MATLPQTSPQGGPNPNSPFNNSVSVLDLPKMGLSTDATLTGAARASLAAQLYGTPQDQSAAVGTKIGLPGFNPSDPSMVGSVSMGPSDPRARSANQDLVDPNAGGMAQSRQLNDAQNQFGTRLGALGNVGPGIGDSIHNWLFGGGGSAEGKQHDAKTYAAGIYQRPETQTYFAAHPGLLAQAEQDPMGFATKLGPVLDAAVAAKNGQAVPGSIVHQTIDGPMAKPDANPALTTAGANATGTTEQQYHAATQAHHYTDQEYLHVMRGLTHNQAKSIWDMQHYLNPQQQATSLALSMGMQQAQGGQLNPAQQQFYTVLKLMNEGGNAVYDPALQAAVK